MNRLCKNCYKILEAHFRKENGNTLDWCYPETGTDRMRDHMYYYPMDNLKYLEYLYEQKTV